MTTNGALPRVLYIRIDGHLGEHLNRLTERVELHRRQGAIPQATIVRELLWFLLTHPDAERKCFGTRSPGVPPLADGTLPSR